MRTDFETLLVNSPAPHVIVVTMNRPAAMNAMNTKMMEEIGQCFAQFYIEPDAARCLVLTGAGDKGFCAGADLKERNGMTDATWRRQHAIVEQTIRAMLDCPLPIIAAVNGAAFAGGCELAMACDFIYAADHARFAQTEVALGIIPGAMGTQNMPRAMGVRRAKELILSATPFNAQQALEWGLANRVVPQADLMREVIAVASRIAANAPVAVRQAKRSMDKATDIDRSNGYSFEIEAYNRTVGTEDRKEGILSFNEKRKPDFKGR